MKVKITELKEKVNKYLQTSGMNEHDSSVMTDLIVEQEMVGNQFSPVGELAGKHARLIENAKDAKEEIATEKPSLKLVKGNGRLAPLITADYLEEIVKKAKTQGIYAFGVYDSTYNEFFDIFCRRIVAKDCIGIIFENGGPQGVVPFGGKKDITGTNPIAYGIPTHKYPMIFDGATAMHAWGRIKQAKENNEKLPDGYLDKAGKETTDPNEAVAILTFGGFKGYAINLLVDVLSGALVRGKSGLDQPADSQRYIGTLIIVIDPAAFGDIKDFKDSTTKLVEDILAVPPVDPNKPVKVPGIRGSERIEQFEKSGEIEIKDEDWEKFLKK
ncbi:MAG: Malate/L-sulfolactate dehydrogenase [Candidatus Woesebacteria bacterium GW2011_GWB1_38_5b]|uniref:Malate/L-sulfolactate dehydrogenase n=1 Tax=Candidatus Woesebacteria bacterium GW2011_GWB1_38_5b TaxID=1618569 RepID=A0A0G0MKY5_9BACT|nr:MAG: Malate/L-sulfolactate dehydrogenase [Candidatus Woesebacteria bacterium GW2011_GWB1_38_5b]